MSSADAIAFMKRLDQDESFRHEVELTRTADQFWTLVAQTGYDFSREEFIEAEQASLHPEEVGQAVPVSAAGPDLSDPDPRHW